MRSLPWSGSVIGQQPIEPGAPKRSMSALSPVMFAMVRGKDDTPRLMARPASPQPRISPTMHCNRACRAGLRSEPAAQSVWSSSSSSERYLSKTVQRGEPSAMTSSGESRSSCCQMGRITSTAKRCTVSQTSRSSTVRYTSISAIFMASLSNDVGDIKDLLHGAQLFAAVGKRRGVLEHLRLPQLIHDSGIAGERVPDPIEVEQLLERLAGPL